MDTYYVYKLTAPDNAVYIGVTKNIKQRIQAHKSYSSNFSMYLKKHGYVFDNCNAETIMTFECDSITKAEFTENRVIEEFYNKNALINRQTKRQRFSNYAYLTSGITTQSCLIANPERFVKINGKYQKRNNK